MCKWHGSTIRVATVTSHLSLNGIAHGLYWSLHLLPMCVHSNCSWSVYISQRASHDNWCTGTRLNRIITVQWEGMVDVGSARYEPVLLPPMPDHKTLLTLCSIKPYWSGMREVVPAHTSLTLHPPSPPTVAGWVSDQNWSNFSQYQNFKCRLNSYSASHDNWCTVGGDGGRRVGEVRASTTSSMPDHKGFKLQ